MAVTISVDVGKKVNSISFPRCAKYFTSFQPRLQVRSASPTVSLITTPSAAPTTFPCPWSEFYTETMESTLVSGIQLVSVIKIEYTIIDDCEGPSPSDASRFNIWW